MTSISPLSDKLKALGVKFGSAEIPQPEKHVTMDSVLKGEAVHTRLGDTYRVEYNYPTSYQHGDIELQSDILFNNISTWAGVPAKKVQSIEGLAFIDTETTGLSGGTGTYTFLIGAGRFIDGYFRVIQYFMRDPGEEAAHLAAFEEFIAPCQGFVTYNGKAFDLPLITTRFALNGWEHPFQEYAHYDLVHLARRLWPERLASRTLGNLEIQILNIARSSEDIPGWMIPQIYFDYLVTGDTQELVKVFYHNLMDVVSLAALFCYTANLLEKPLEHTLEHGVDIIALAKLFENIGDFDTAAKLYIDGLDHELPQSVLLEAIHRLAMLYKKNTDLDKAVALWQEAARHQYLSSQIELAKYYEHQAMDIESALYWTRSAISQVSISSPLKQASQEWLPELEHRLHRLENKLSASAKKTT